MKSDMGRGRIDAGAIWTFLRAPLESRTLRGAAGAVLAAALLSSCASARTETPLKMEPEAVRSAARYRKEYVLRPGDKIEVVVRRAPEVSRSVIVRPDGYISLPTLNDVKADSLTIPELAEKLTGLFSARLLNPEVTVIATEVHPAVVYVVGHVIKPTVLPLSDAPTAMQAIALAGGLAPTAAAKDVAVIRLCDDGYLRALMSDAPVDGQPGPYMALRATPLQADDLVFVPEGGRSQVARFLTDLVITPLQPINFALGIVANYKLVMELNRPRLP